MMAIFHCLFVVGVLSSVLLTNCKSAATITLDLKEEFNVTWTVDDLNNPKFITFKLAAKRAGWIALGFSPNGGMAGSDIIKAAIDGEGTVELLDMYASGETEPQVDSNPSDVELLSGSRTDGMFQVTFKRPLTNCDPQDLDITEDTTRLIFAWGTSDAFQYHGANSRGSKSVYLLAEPKPVIPDAEPDVMVHEFVYETGFRVPEGEDTIYTYAVVKAPQIMQKHHIISYDAVVTSGSEGYVHHMILFACFHDFNASRHLEEKIVYNYYTMPVELLECRNNAMLAWAVGGENFHLPEHTGIPIGDDLSPKAWLLGIHYNNPTRQSAGTHVDFSGMRIRYTASLRRHDAGYLEVGSISGLYIPPGQPEFHVRADCSSACTQELPEEGVNVFGYILHAHLASRSISVFRHRNGHTDLIAEDRGYDFNFQTNKAFQPELKLLPGDEITVLCKMNSSDRTEMTYGGLGTRDEMCVVFLFLYPRAPGITQCRSRGYWSRQRGWKDDFSTRVWSDEAANAAERDEMMASYLQTCQAQTSRHDRLEGEVFEPRPVSVECPANCKPSTCTPKAWQATASSGTTVVFSLVLLSTGMFHMI